MSEAYLQILLMIAYLAIGLISVSFPIYAICVTYLRQELKETEVEKKQISGTLKERISDLTKELSGEKKDSSRFKEIQQIINDHGKELEKLEKDVESITASGAVITPLITLGFTLIAACLGTYYYYENVDSSTLIFLGTAIFCVGVSIYFLLRTVFSIEKAALRTARTVQFDACFKSMETTEEIKLGEEIILDLGFKALENVEKFGVRTFIPPEIELKNPTGYIQPAGCRYPNYNLILYERDYLVANAYAGLRLKVVAKKLGTFKIPIVLSGKGLFEYETEVYVKVVK